MSVFGISIEGNSKEEVIQRVKQAESFVWIVTANPEILLEARKNSNYKKAILEANLRTIDGFGLYVFERFILRRKVNRTTGVELSRGLVRLAEKSGMKLGLIGGGAGTAEKAANELKRAFPNLIIHAESGGEVSSKGEDDSIGEEARYRLSLFEPEILLVAFGHPKQELWIQRYKGQFPKLRAAVGVGGTLDFWTGNKKRAPIFFQKVGIEWFWRLMQEPKRIGRICKAIFIFPILALLDLFGSS